jgi:hypothetical protein
VKFDAYAATMDTDAPSVYHPIAERFHGMWSDLAEPRWGYTHAQKLHYAGNSALLFHRSKEGVPETHLTVQGRWSVDLARHLRLVHPEHSVTRADVCIDHDAPGFWDWIIPIAIDLAEAHKVQIKQSGDWITPAGALRGRTLYIGSTQSASMIRIYEKGKKHRYVDRDDDTASLDWVRIEVQCRPARDFKKIAWLANPEQFFASNKVATALLSILANRQVERTAAYGKQPPRSHSVKFRNFAKQYGEFILTLADTLGPDELVQLLRDQLASPQSPDILQARSLYPETEGALAEMSAPQAT